MGNHQFGSQNHPKPGQIMTIVPSSFTVENKLPPSVIYQGTKVKVLGTYDMACSRPGAPKITVSLVLLPNNQKELILTNNLR